MSTGSKTFWLQTISDISWSTGYNDTTNFLDKDDDTYSDLRTSSQSIGSFYYDCSAMPKSAITTKVQVVTKHSGQHTKAKINHFATIYLRKYNASSKWSDIFDISGENEWLLHYTIENAFSLATAKESHGITTVHIRTISSDNTVTDNINGTATTTSISEHNIASVILQNYSSGQEWRYGTSSHSGPGFYVKSWNTDYWRFYSSKLIVDYTLPDWTITASSNDSTMGTVNGSSSDTFTINEEGSYTLTASPNSGYYFSHWAKATSPSTPIEGASATWTLTGEKYYDDFGASGNFVAVFKALPKLTYSFSQYIGSLSGGYIDVYVVDGGTSTRIIDGATTAGEYTFSEAQLGKALQIRFIPDSLRPEGTFLRSYTINGETTLNDTVGTVVKDISSISADITLITNFSRYPKVEITVAPEGTTGVVDGQSFKPTLTSYVMPSSSRTFTASDTDSFAESQTHGDHGGYFYQWLQGSTIVSEKPALTVAVATSDLAYTLVYKPYLAIAVNTINCQISSYWKIVKQGGSAEFVATPDTNFYSDRAELEWTDPDDPTQSKTDTISAGEFYGEWTFYVTPSDEADINMDVYGKANPTIKLESLLWTTQLMSEDSPDILTQNILNITPQLSYISQIAYKIDGNEYFIDVPKEDYQLVLNDPETNSAQIEVSENFLSLYNDDSINEMVLVGQPLNSEEEPGPGFVWFGGEEPQPPQSVVSTTLYRPGQVAICNARIDEAHESVTWKGWYTEPSGETLISLSNPYEYVVEPYESTIPVIRLYALYKAWPQILAVPMLLMRYALVDGVPDLDYSWYYAGGSVSIDPETTYYEPGTTVTLTATPEGDNVFFQWAKAEDGIVFIPGATEPIFEYTVEDGDEIQVIIAVFIEKGKLSCIRINNNNTCEPSLYKVNGVEVTDFQGYALSKGPSTLSVNPYTSPSQYASESYLFQGKKFTEYNGSKFSSTNNIIYLSGSEYEEIPNCFYAEGIKAERDSETMEVTELEHIQFYCIYNKDEYGVETLTLHDTEAKEGLSCEYDHVVVYCDIHSGTGYNILSTYSTDPAEVEIPTEHSLEYLGFRAKISDKATMKGHFFDGTQPATTTCGYFSATDHYDGMEYTVTQEEQNFYCKPDTTMTFKAYPADGWVFQRWDIYDEETGTYIELEHPTDTTITVKHIQYDWEPQLPWEVHAHFLHTIQVTAIGYDIVDDREESTPGEFCTITGTGEKVIGSTVTLTCIPNNDYIFAYWVYGGQIYYDNPILTFTAPSQPVRAVAHVKQKRDCVYMGNQTLKQKGYDPVIAIYQGTTEIPIEYVHP